MLIIDRLLSPVPAPELAGIEADTLILTWQQRRWPRGRLTTSKGREIALALPTGTLIQPGTLLWANRDWYLCVVAADEPVLALEPADWATAVRAAFEIGNRHFPLAIEGRALLVQDDPALVQLFHRNGIPFERRMAPFNPIGTGHSHVTSSIPEPTAIC